MVYNVSVWSEWCVWWSTMHIVRCSDDDRFRIEHSNCILDLAKNDFVLAFTGPADTQLMMKILLFPFSWFKWTTKKCCWKIIFRELCPFSDSSFDLCVLIQHKGNNQPTTKKEDTRIQVIWDNTLLVILTGICAFWLD